jgi:hypothetical protein
MPSLINLLGGFYMAEMVRLNVRVSKRLGDWLDKETEETGVPKSTIVYLALEQYMTQKEAMSMMNEKMPVYKELLEKIEKLEKANLI